MDITSYGFNEKIHLNKVSKQSSFNVHKQFSLLLHVLNRVKNNSNQITFNAR